jgi:hypothetical protein
MFEVIVGSYFATMVSTSFPNALGIFKTMAMTMKTHSFHAADSIRKLITFSEKPAGKGCWRWKKRWRTWITSL